MNPNNRGSLVAGVILIPGGVSLVWFGIFGGAAITAEQNGAGLAALPLEGQWQAQPP